MFLSFWRFYNAFLWLTRLLLLNLNSKMRQFWAILPQPIKTVQSPVHLAIWVFWAGLLTLWAPAGFSPAVAMTTVVTVCLIPWRAKWPSGGYSEKLAIHTVLSWIPLKMAVWVDFNDLGHLPVLTRKAINLLLPGNLTRKVSSVAIQLQCGPSTDLAWMVQDNTWTMKPAASISKSFLLSPATLSQ